MKLIFVVINFIFDYLNFVLIVIFKENILH